MAEQQLAIGVTSSASATCSGTTYAKNYTIIAQCKLNSVDTVNAKANITVNAVLKSANYTAWGSDSCTFSIAVDGTVKNSASASSGGSGSSATSTKTYATWTGDVDYASDGNLSLTITAKVTGGDTAYTPGSGTAEFVAVFPYVARQSEITSVTGTYLGSAVTVAIDRKNDAFVHKVEYSFAGSAYTTATSTGGTSVSFTPALSLASNIPNSTSGTLTVRVTTLNGTTQIGDAATKSITLKLPDSVVPSFTSVTATHSSDNSTVSGWGIYVRTFSKAVVKINGASGIYGSTIKSYLISGAGFSGTSSSLTTGLLNTAGTFTFTATITDTRGRTASKTVSITVVDYQKPSISVTAQRCLSDGTISTSGTYLKVTATYSYASVSSKNTISRSVSCNGVSNTSFASGTAFVLACSVVATTAYELTATISDALGGSDTKTVKITTDIVLATINEEKNGIVWGSYDVEDDTFKVDIPLKMSGGIEHIAIPANADLNDYKTTGFYYCDLNITVATLSNCPTSIAFYLHVAKNAGYSQILIEYTREAPYIYYRNYYTGTWGSWHQIYSTINETFEGNITGHAQELYATRESASADTLEAIRTFRVVERYGNSSVGDNGLPNQYFYHIYNTQSVDSGYTSQLALGMTTNKVFYRLRANKTWWDWMEIPLWTVGTIVCTNTNSAPSDYGTWELIDKEFKSQLINPATFTINTTNCTSNGVIATLHGHSVQLRMVIVNKVAVADTTLTFGTLSLASVGVTGFPISYPDVVGGSDGGNALTTWTLDGSTGVLSSTDAPHTTNGMGTGKTTLLYFNIGVTKDNMLDSFCDRFYWKRTA